MVLARLIRRHKARAEPGRRSFFGRLARDRRGNVLAMVAAMILPITGIIGSGLDMGRAYLVKTRLQQACDAGVLAGRRKMAASGVMTPDVVAEVTKYAQFNFPQLAMDTSTYTVAPTMTATNETINLSLQTNMNTALMQLFGITKVPLQVSCSARDDYVNVDILLVLDTTGSMACKPERNEADCNSYALQNGVYAQTTIINNRFVTYTKEEMNGSTNISRMQGLRDALTSLRSQMATIETQFNTAGASTRKRIRWAIVPFSQMTNPGFSVGTAGTTLYDRNPTWFNTSGLYRETYACGPGGRSTCAYNPATVNHTTSGNGNWMATTWDGCVEERVTNNTITPTSGHQIPNNLPSDAYDLMFDTVPSSTATRWTVADESATGISQYACPKAMREWAPMTTSDFNDYFKFSTGFVANGGTYLDLGMLWAARLLSRSGMWASENPTTYNGFKVARYVILMTDGEMQTGNSGYGAYAQEFWARRTTTDGAAVTAVANHSRRWLMTCSAIKNNMDAKIYSISFGAGSSLSADLDSCSSGAGYGFKANDSAELNAVFARIADNIGSLRLSQ